MQFNRLYVTVIAIVILVLFALFLSRIGAAGAASSTSTEPLRIERQWARFCTDYQAPFDVQLYIEPYGNQYSDDKFQWVQCLAKHSDQQFYHKWKQACYANTDTTAPFIKILWYSPWSQQVICFKEGAW